MQDLKFYAERIEETIGYLNKYESPVCKEIAGDLKRDVDNIQTIYKEKIDKLEKENAEKDKMIKGLGEALESVCSDEKEME